MTDKAYELFNLILDGEGNWDYSTLEELLDITYKEGHDEGYKKAKSEQPVIKQLEFHKFNKGVAVSPFGDYHIAFDDEDLIFEVWQNGEILDTCKTVEDAINYCNEDYLKNVESCFISEQKNETES